MAAGPVQLQHEFPGLSGWLSPAGICQQAVDLQVISVMTPLQVLKISKSGKTRKIYVRRRDLLRGHKLQPRDLRRIDPSLSLTKTSPNVTVKESCVLINLGGVRQA